MIMIIRNHLIRDAQTMRPAGPCVFDLSVSGGPGDLEGAGGREKTKTKNKGGAGAQGLQTAPRRGLEGETGIAWGIFAEVTFNYMLIIYSL
jgi:hypothetical protein